MTQSRNRSFWQELKSRKVVRAGGMYLAVGWGAVLGGSELAQILELPAWVPKLILTLVLVGFPIAMVLAWVFDVTSEGVRRTSDDARSSSQLAWSGWALTLTLAAAVAAFVLRPSFSADEPTGVPRAATTDPQLVAIMPFRYSGPAELSYLEGGVPQLLSARFTGKPGPRATDPTATAALWDAAYIADPTVAMQRVATGLGAGLVLSGGVVAGPNGLTITASLQDITSGTEVASGNANGPPEELTGIVDRLAGALLSLSVGEYEEGLDQLTSADPEALREYLVAQVEFRQGRWISSRDHFVRATERDSTFALAALWAADAGNNVPGARNLPFLELAWRHRDRLAPKDRIYLEARLADASGAVTRAEAQQAYGAVTEATPDRANAWYFLGEVTMHFPTDPADFGRARGYFERALSLEPTNINALLHLQMSQSLVGDIEAMLVTLDQIAALDTTEVRQVGNRLVQAVERGDSIRGEPLFDSIFGIADAFIDVVYWPLDAKDMLNSEWQTEALIRGLQTMKSRISPSDEFGEMTYASLYYISQDLGLGESAEGILAEMDRSGVAVSDRGLILNSMYGALSEDAGLAAVTRLRERLGSVDEADRDFDWVQDIGVVQLWAIQHGDNSGVAATVYDIRSAVRGQPTPEGLSSESIALLLEAMVKAQRGDSSALRSVREFEAILVQGPPYGGVLRDALILGSATVYEAFGDLSSASVALEREGKFQMFHNPFGARFARERGRLAEALGDTARAVEEYEYYSVLRSRSDLQFRAQLDTVRAALGLLKGS